MDARAKAEALLVVERDASATAICNFMRACGVRLKPGHVPEAIQQELTRLAYACLDLGNDYAHDKDTIPHHVHDSTPAGAFGEERRPSSSQRLPAVELPVPPSAHRRDKR